MHAHILAVVPAMVVTTFAMPVVAETTAVECTEAAAAFTEMRLAKPKLPGLGWIMYTPQADFDGLAKADQWKNVAERLSVEIRADQLEVAGDPNFTPATSDNARQADAQMFLMLNVLEACLRAEALVASPDIKVEITQFDAQFTPEIRASLQSKMKARL